MVVIQRVTTTFNLSHANFQLAPARCRRVITEQVRLSTRNFVAVTSLRYFLTITVRGDNAESTFANFTSQVVNIIAFKVPIKILRNNKKMKRTKRQDFFCSLFFRVSLKLFYRNAKRRRDNCI